MKIVLFNDISRGLLKYIVLVCHRLKFVAPIFDLRHFTQNNIIMDSESSSDSELWTNGMYIAEGRQW
jgi:hypothetical protein